MNDSCDYIPDRTWTRRRDATGSESTAGDLLTKPPCLNESEVVLMIDERSERTSRVLVPTNNYDTLVIIRFNRIEQRWAVSCCNEGNILIRHLLS